jgi:hypothetical protein
MPDSWPQVRVTKVLRPMTCIKVFLGPTELIPKLNIALHNSNSATILNEIIKDFALMQPARVEVG